MYMSFGKHVFITTHGKDEKYLKQGLPLILDYKTEILIQRYLDSKNINSPYISVIKGDLHNLSEQNTYKIRYKNLPSFLVVMNGYIQILVQQELVFLMKL